MNLSNKYFIPFLGCLVFVLIWIIIARFSFEQKEPENAYLITVTPEIQRKPIEDKNRIGISTETNREDTSENLNRRIPSSNIEENEDLDISDIDTVTIFDSEDEYTSEDEHNSEPIRNTRYASIVMTAAERRELAVCIYIEAGSEPPEGQQAVAEVVLNRVLHRQFPDTVHGVLHFGEETMTPQFSSVVDFDKVWPNQEQYDAIDRALYGEPILDEDVVFFDCYAINDRIWGQIGNHVFCRENPW